MSDPQPVTSGPTELTLVELVDRAKPMDDLSRFVIVDLTEEDEAGLFSILADAYPRLGRRHLRQRRYLEDRGHDTHTIDPQMEESFHI